MKKIFLLSILCLSLVSGISAEADNIYENYDQSLGGYYGEIGGWGLSYQQWFGTAGLEIAGVRVQAGLRYRF